ncbi:hypothetical protein JOD66_002385 [Nocardioides nitrophenolicus]|nr:DUF2867 domain-containing protein [Nocardioides nitrophenolicus]MBM7517418.1 hypothetical protein [Nocardioides nitrophenolicus]
MHLGLVETGSGRCRGRMAVLVKPNERLGRIYLATIKPIRHRIVYPLMIRALARSWAEIQRTAA